MKLLFYCTKAKPYLVKDAYLVKDGGKYFIGGSWWLRKWSLNGKIVGECDFEVEKIDCIHNKHSYSYEYNNLDIINEKCELLSNSCLNWEELDDYLCANNGYAIHIKNLKIFDEPRELSDYYDIHIKSHLYNAPQNMMYCYDYIKTKQGLTGVCNGHYVKKILISIHPEWLCKILNGEKTIEFRKKVLKEML